MNMLLFLPDMSDNLKNTLAGSYKIHEDAVGFLNAEKVFGILPCDDGTTCQICIFIKNNMEKYLRLKEEQRDRESTDDPAAIRTTTPTGRREGQARKSRRPTSNQSVG